MDRVRVGIDMEDVVDLGDNHTLRLSRYGGKDEIVGGIIEHTKTDGMLCAGAIWFDCEVTRKVFSNRPRWTVEKWRPLTLSPSFLCHCGDHGFIREGKWVRA